MACNQNGCKEPGAYRFTWPGKDEARICAEHVTKLLSVAGAMGFYIQVIPLTNVELIEEINASEAGHAE